MQKFLNYINGNWKASSSKKWFTTTNPANTKETLGKVAHSNQNDINDAVKAAKKAYETWRLVPAPKRGELLFKVAELLIKKKKELGDFVCKEMGKVKAESHGDVQEAIDMAYYMAGEGRRLFGQTMPSELRNKHLKTVREPLGVWALITPWNFPTAIPAWKLCPALIAGNTVVFKTSMYVPGSATKLVEVFEEAGFPPGVVNLIHGPGSDVGEPLVKHTDVVGVSFTGSSAVGSKVAGWCAPEFKRYSLEMGGKNLHIVLNDANLELAIEATIWGAFGTTGQRCTATSRVIIEKGVYDKFIRLFTAKTKKLKLGSGLSKQVDVGPLINEDAVRKAEKYVAIAKAQKTRLVLGGKRPKNMSQGHFFEPTIYKDVTPKHTIFTDEIFAPIISFVKANNLSHAIQLANTTAYGLSSAIFTRNVNAAYTAERDLQTGLVYINASTIGAEIQTPFGGYKNTGNGHREAGGEGGAIDTYTEVKVIATDFSDSLQKAQIDD